MRSADEQAKLNAEISKLVEETVKYVAEARKLDAEANKMRRETAWYPFVLMTGAFTAGMALAKVMIG